jgi:anti-repressor protein
MSIIKQRNALNKAIVANEEYINLGKIIENTDGAITIGQYAKLISSKVDMGRNRLYKWFRDNGYFINKGDDKNTPKQIYIESGLFKLHEKVVQTENGEILSVKPLITGKGQKYFTAKILENGYLN